MSKVPSAKKTKTTLKRDSTLNGPTKCHKQNSSNSQPLRHGLRTATSNRASSQLSNQISNQLSSQISNQTSNLKGEPSNISNFYQQQKKRLHTNNDSFERSPVKSLLKKHRKSCETESKIDHLPITWATENVNVDCQLRCELQINNQSSEQDTSQSFKSNGIKMDQILMEFHAKLQFDGLSSKENDKDSGNEEEKESSNEFDELDDSWMLKSNELLNELERKIKSSTDQSKESGVGSCNSLDLNKQSASPMIVGGSQEDRSNHFKIPETPAKASTRLSSFSVSTQFNSTPKVVSRQSNKLNQSLHFEDISPIKGNDSCFVNIRQESKRALNDSINLDNASCKKRNGKILFGTPVRQQQSNNQQTNKHTNCSPSDDFDTDLVEDSFDMILSQVDDKLLSTNTQQPRLRTNNQQRTQSLQSSQRINQQVRPKTIYSQPVNRPNSNYLSSNNARRPTVQQQLARNQSPSLQSIGKSAQASSIQLKDDSSTLFAKQCSKMNANNLNSVKRNSNQLKNEVRSQLSESYLMDDDDADFICSQVHL